jgi:hypothetical protein
MRFAANALSIAVLLAEPSVGRAAEPAPGDAPDLDDVTGIERPAEDRWDTAREAADLALVLPRELVDALLRSTEAAAALIADEQLVPRYRDLLATRGGDILLFPTLFAETNNIFSVGARMIARSRHLSATQRVGFGGVEDIASESRVRIEGGRRPAFALTGEWFYEIASEREYHGVGAQPESDARNRFVPGQTERVGLYRQRHVRGLAGFGLRPADPLELFASGSVARRDIADASDAGGETLSRVFVRDALPGAGSPSWIGYAELAARFDNRETRARPSPGLLLETYAGGAQRLRGEDPVAFMRMGGRAAGFVSIYRRSNILSPRLVLDGLAPLGGVPVPFTELPRQPDFRGFDTRRDFVSMVASIDYTWELVTFASLRLFADAATVAPALDEIGRNELEGTRFAAGLGIDLYARDTPLGAFALAFSPDGVRAHLSLGVPQRYGDRQHRD